MAYEKAIVISHERSGTHFLINTLIRNFAYAPDRIDLDYGLGLNLHHPGAVAKFFERFLSLPGPRIAKSHHSIEFLAPHLDTILNHCHVFYIYRDPRDVMTSCWRFMNELEWDEGPKVETVSEYMRSQPRAAMLRYQKSQSETCADRWRDHVSGWLGALNGRKHHALTYVAYEDLHRNFDTTVQQLAKRLHRPCFHPERPDPNTQVVRPWRAEVGSHRDYFNSNDETWLRNRLDAPTEKLLDG